MKKDTYYFSHDATAKDDPKCMLLIDQLGLEGYGIFWVLVETLRTQPDYKCPLNIVPSLAKRFSTSKEKMDAVIRGFGLFQIEEDTLFFSDSLLRRMSHADDKRAFLSESGKKGNELRWNKNRLLSPPDSEAITTQSQLKESKVNEIRVNEIHPFKEFWNLYDKKRSLPKTQNLWDKISDKDREAIMKYIPLYKKAQPDKTYRKDPITFLRNRSWEDEIIVSQVKTSAAPFSQNQSSDIPTPQRPKLYRGEDEV